MSDEVARKLRELLASVEAPSRPKVTVAQIWERYETSRPVSPDTLDGYRSMWRCHVGPYFGDMPAEEITSEHIRTYRDKRREDLADVGGAGQSSWRVHGQTMSLQAAARYLGLCPDLTRLRMRKAGIWALYGGMRLRAQRIDKRTVLPPKRPPRRVSPATRNREVSLLRTIVLWGVRERMISSCLIAATADKEPEHNIRENVLPADAWTRLLAVATEFDKVFLHLAVHSGLRRREIAKVRWEHIHLDAGILEVSAASAKFGKARKTILSEDTVRLLERWSPPGGRAGWVLRSDRTGTHVTPGWLFSRFRRLCDLARLEDGPSGRYTLHDLRRTWTTRMVQDMGVSETETMKMLGHSTSETIRRYNISSADSLIRAKAAWDAGQAAFRRKVLDSMRPPPRPRGRS